MNKIPKIIHYCWLSNDPKPQMLLDCMDSWKKQMPDYELRCWDMKRFDINSVPFVADACKAKKWATATDYIRLYALYHEGGIYMDLDVMVYKSFDPFLHHAVFSSVEFWPKHFFKSLKKGSHSGLGIEAGVMGAQAGHPWVKAMMEPYATIKFEHTEVFMNFIIMSGRIAEISAEKFGFKFQPVYQLLENDVHIYPPDVFSRQCSNHVTKYATHLCANSWRDPVVKKTWNKLRSILRFKK